jgi:hypothetical protein
LQVDDKRNRIVIKTILIHKRGSHILRVMAPRVRLGLATAQLPQSGRQSRQ